ncbi:MAG TPA: hypothetical protein VHQ86_00435 [Candidatus Saccharimonadia bacterium]|nr:hypothetical protein [Candidatus Saccharimonadia bacterium]
MRNRRGVVVAWIACLCATLLTTPAAWAADPLQSITASPTNESVSLSAGGTYDGFVKITNTGQTPYQFIVSASPFSVTGESYDQSFAARPDLIDASKWFSFARTTYSANPRDEIAVAYHIKVPTDIAAGGYYAAIFAEASNTSAGQGVTSHKRVGVLMYITVTGDVIKSGKVLGYNLPLIHTQPPLHADVRLQNTGNVHYDATTSLVVSDIFGNTKARLESTNTIFPKSTRKLSLTWDKAPSFGLFQVSGTVKYLDKTEQLPTRYTLMLSANAFLIIFIAVILLAAYAYLTRKRRSNVVRRRR